MDEFLVKCNEIELVEDDVEMASRLLLELATVEEKVTEDETCHESISQSNHLNNFPFIEPSLWNQSTACQVDDPCFN
jgi:hypothetical protein